MICGRGQEGVWARHEGPQGRFLAVVHVHTPSPSLYTRHSSLLPSALTAASLAALLSFIERATHWFKPTCLSPFVLQAQAQIQCTPTWYAESAFSNPAIDPPHAPRPLPC